MAESSTSLVNFSTSSLKTTEQSSTKFLSSFFQRGFLFILLTALIPLFPSEAPEFLNKSILSASWELLHLLFVGIVISYGLFCRRSADNSMQNEIPCKVESPHESFLNKILHVSSVFNDDSNEFDSSKDDEAVNRSKFQTWSSQYQRNEPVVVVADACKDNAANKPLFLPVRSLKSSARDSDSFTKDDRHDASDNDDHVKEFMNSTDEPSESVVLPSPIPWRSRSERMKMESNKGMAPPTAVCNGDTGAFCSPTLQTNSITRLQSSSNSLSPELRANINIDMMVKKKSFRSSSLAPPPVHGYHAIFDKKGGAKNFKDELKYMCKRGNEDLHSCNDDVLDPHISETKTNNNFDSSPIQKAIRTMRSKNAQSAAIDTTRRSSSDRSIRYDIQTENMNEFPARLIVSPDDSDDSDSEKDGDHHIVAEISRENDALNSGMKAESDDNEVDKKADEFIAKFREQIRFQRVDSIKKTTIHRNVTQTKTEVS